MQSLREHMIEYKVQIIFKNLIRFLILHLGLIQYFPHLFVKTLYHAAFLFTFFYVYFFPSLLGSYRASNFISTVPLVRFFCFRGIYWLPNGTSSLSIFLFLCLLSFQLDKKKQFHFS